MRYPMTVTGAVLLASLAPATLVAQEPERRPGEMGERMEHMQHMRRHMDPMLQIGVYAPPHLLERREALGLSAEQVTRLEALAQEIKAVHEKAEADARPHHEQLMAAWQADQPDAAAVRRHAQALMRVHHDAHLKTLESAVKAKALLTAEQRGRVAGWLDARHMRRERMERRRQHDGPPRGATPRRQRRR